MDTSMILSIISIVISIILSIANFFFKRKLQREQTDQNIEILNLNRLYEDNNCRKEIMIHNHKVIFSYLTAVSDIISSGNENDSFKETKDVVRTCVSEELSNDIKKLNVLIHNYFQSTGHYWEPATKDDLATQYSTLKERLIEYTRKEKTIIQTPSAILSPPNTKTFHTLFAARKDGKSKESKLTQQQIEKLRQKKKRFDK